MKNNFDERNDEYKTQTYKELSAKCRGAFVISWILVRQMYYRLTRVDGLKYRGAVSRIWTDHKDLFSRDTLVRHLAKDDPTVERRITTKYRKSSSTGITDTGNFSSTKDYNWITSSLSKVDEIQNIFNDMLEYLPGVENDPTAARCKPIVAALGEYAVTQIKDRDKAIKRLLKELALREVEMQSDARIHAAELRVYEAGLALRDHMLKLPDLIAGITAA